MHACQAWLRSTLNTLTLCPRYLWGSTKKTWPGCPCTTLQRDCWSSVSLSCLENNSCYLIVLSILLHYAYCLFIMCLIVAYCCLQLFISCCYCSTSLVVTAYTCVTRFGNFLPMCLRCLFNMLAVVYPSVTLAHHCSLAMLLHVASPLLHVLHLSSFTPCFTCFHAVHSLWHLLAVLFRMYKVRSE